MGAKVKRVTLWVAGIEDKPGGLHSKLAPLAEAGARLEFVLARRAPDKPGTGVVFLTPLVGTKQLAAAKKAGFRKSKSINGLRVEGADKPGLGAKITQLLAEANINLRGLSAAVIGKRYVMYLALDTAGDAAKAARILEKMR